MTVDGDPGRIDQVIAFVKGTVEPLVRQQPGSCGLAMFVNRDKGRVAVTTAWESDAARAASAAPLAPVRGEIGRILGGEVRPEEFEVAVIERLQPARPGYWNRTTRLAVPPGRLDDAVGSFRSEVLPGLRGQEGFCGGVLLVNRTTGTAVGATTWSSRAALEHSRPAADQLRAGAADSSGARIVEVVETEIVIAGITPPQQHEDKFRRAYAAMSAGGDLNDLDAVINADYIEHAALPPGVPTGLPGLKALMGMYREGFPDLTMAIERYLEQGDTGCAVVRLTGTNTGSFLGAPASGRPIDITVIDVVRVVDGRCAEHWGVQDDLSLFTQLGVSSIPTQQAVSIELPSETRV
ncbi:MAG: ester cyclase [Actinobacteria bacterium]|nr:ester cyclase [Actinomycetota bacterium]